MRFEIKKYNMRNKKYRNKIKKKSFGEIDLIISLTLFFGFLVWFFINVIPRFSISINPDLMISPVENLIETECTETIYKFPIILYGLKDSNNYPVKFKLYNINYSNFDAYDNLDISKYKDNIIFLYNLNKNKTKQIYFIYSKYNYTKIKKQDFDLTSNHNETIINSKEIYYKFNNYKLSSINFKSNNILNNVKYIINGYDYQEGRYNYSLQSNLVIYNYISDLFSLDTLVYANNTLIDLFFNPPENIIPSYNISLEFDIKNFTNFIINNHNNILYYDGVCYSYNIKSIDFKDNKVGFLIFSDNNFSLNFCNYNVSKIHLIINTNLNNKISFFIHNSSYDFKNILNNYELKKGGIIKTIGLSSAKINKLINDLNNSRNMFNYEFSFTIYNASNLSQSLFSYNKDKFLKTNAYTKQYYSNLIDKYGHLKPILISIIVWEK